MTLEYRSFNDVAEVADLDDSRHEVLVRFPYDVRDSYKTRQRPGLWERRSAKNRDRPPISVKPPIMCWSHLAHEPIGRGTGSQDTNASIEVRAQFSDFNAVPRALQAFTQLRDGDIKAFSFGFERLADEMSREIRGVRDITEGIMYEISPVVFESVPGAEAIDVRSAGGLVAGNVADIAKMFDDGLIDRHEARSLLASLAPLEDRERIVVDRRTIDGRISTNDLRDLLRTALADRATGTSMAWAEDFTDDQLVYSINEKYYQCAYALNGAEILLGEPTEVQLVREWVPIDEVADELNAEASEDIPETRAAAKAGAAKPYGDIAYADPGFLDNEGEQVSKSGKKPKARYALNSKPRIRAAWVYISRDSIAAQYTADQLTKIKSAIQAAGSKAGINFAETRSAEEDPDVAAVLAEWDAQTEPVATPPKREADVALAQLGVTLSRRR